MRNERLNKEIVTRLIADYQFKRQGEWLRQGRCPACNKRELYVNAANPWTLKCARLNKCGAEINVKDSYRDLFESFNERYKPTPQAPNATADAYMEYSRGLPPESMRGWYRQESFYHPKAIGKKGTGTVRFDISRENNVFMERFIETLTVEDEDGDRRVRKANFGGKYRGLWWEPPGQLIEDGDQVWIVEACIDAASLALSGAKAVAALSCNNYPEIALKDHAEKDVTWIWALDDDNAGRRYCRKHVATMKEAGFEKVAAAFIPSKRGVKRDFNDAYKAGELEADNLKHYRYIGNLHLAPTALARALETYHHTGRAWFNFEFKNRLYNFDMDLAKFAKAKEELEKNPDGGDQDIASIIERAAQQSGTLSEIANCYPEFLYFQVNVLTDESWYYTRIRFPHGAKDAKNTFTGAQLSAPTEFKKRLLSIAAGSIFTGSKGQLDQFLKDNLHGIKTVETVEFVGYSKAHGAYVFNDIAMKEGRVVDLNDEDFFEIGNLSIKSLNQSVHLHIGDDQEYWEDWPQLIWECFGERGMVALAFWFASLFAEQIRAAKKSFPFLEIVGAPGAGKSTLIEFLWRLLGRPDYEGFDPSKSTPAARARIMSQVSNLPVVFIEGDRDDDTGHSRKFDFDELKTAYNGRASRATGVRNGGNETREPPFRGSVVISQNASVNASEAVLQRIIHLYFDTSGHTQSSKAAAEKLESIPMSAVSAFLRKACATERASVATIIEKSRQYEKELVQLEGLKSHRLAQNHAVVMAAVDAMAGLIGITEQQHEAIYSEVRELALARQVAISDDHQHVRDFWDTFDFLNEASDGDARLNHSINPDIIAVNLNHFVQVAVTRKQQIPALADLKKHLKSSRSRRFKGIQTVKSALHSRLDKPDGWTCKCWCFEAER